MSLPPHKQNKLGENAKRNPGTRDKGKDKEKVGKRRAETLISASKKNVVNFTHERSRGTPEDWKMDEHEEEERGSEEVWHCENACEQHPQIFSAYTAAVRVLMNTSASPWEWDDDGSPSTNVNYPKPERSQDNSEGGKKGKDREKERRSVGVRHHGKNTRQGAKATVESAKGRAQPVRRRPFDQVFVKFNK